METDPADIARRLAPGFAARATGYDANGGFPVDDFTELRAEGLLGLMVPTRLGGMGAGVATYAEVAYELARGSGATALVFNMHSAVTGALSTVSDEMLAAVGVPDTFYAARDRMLTSVAAGAWYAVAMSERGVGSRLSQMSTSYRLVDGTYHLKGSKTFVSGAGNSDGYLVAARCADNPDLVSQFLVPADTPGVVVEHTWDSLGMRATASHDLHIDAAVPADALVGGIEGLALVVIQLLPHWLVSSYAAVYVGVAQAALDAGRAYVNERKLGHLPAIRARLGRADAAVAAAKLAVDQAARRADESPGEPETNRWVWRAKLLAGTTAADVAASMLEAAGTSATRRGNPLERLYRDARCGSLQPPTSDVCADWLGVAALGGNPETDGTGPRW